MIVTRMHGRRVALNKIPTGVTPNNMWWVGEYRDENNRPLNLQKDGHGHYRHPLVTAIDIYGVLHGLDQLADWKTR